MKNITRRKFIGAAAATAGATLALKSTALGKLTSSSARSRLAQLDWAAFSKFQNTAFTFSKPGVAPVTLTLATIEDSRPAKKRTWKAGQECFVLHFTGAPRLELPQSTYSVNHFMLGNFDLFITEGRRTGRVRTFFAVINRVTS